MIISLFFENVNLYLKKKLTNLTVNRTVYLVYKRFKIFFYKIKLE